MGSKRFSEPAVFGTRRMKWSEGKIAHRLWGDANGNELPSILPDRQPRDWVSGREPVNPLPLDMFVSRLRAGIAVSGRPDIKLNADAFPRWEDGEVVQMCPYEAARRYVDWAIGHACTEQRKARDIATEIRPEIPEAKKRLRSLAGALGRTSQPLAAVLKLAHVRASHNMLLKPDLSTLQAANRVAALLAELSALLPAAIDEIEEQGAANAQTGAGDVWGVTFVSELGDAWVRMVAELPTATGTFAEFVEAAWNSLEDPAPEERGWERQIKTAIKHKGEGWRHTLIEFS